MNCKICFEEYEVDKDNYIIEDGKKTNKQIIICPKCKGILCSDCMINGFKVGKVFKCLLPNCDYEYNDIIYLYTHFNKEQLEEIKEVFKNEFLKNEKQIIDTSLNIKYRIAGNMNKILSVIIESCDEEIVKKVGEIVNDDDQNKYRELLKTKDEKDIKTLINKDKELIEELKKEVKNKIETMFETITYFINNETVNIDSENTMFNESAINMVYDWYPNLITILSKEDFLYTFRCFYTFMKYFYRKNKNGVKPMVEVLLFMCILYEKIDKTQNKYLYYLKHFINNNNDIENNGYEIVGQFKTIYNGKFLRNETEYYIINNDMLFRKFELFPNHKNIDWNILNCIKTLFYYIDISSLNVKAMLKQQKFMTCKNKNCDGNCYKYNDQIRCDKCNTIFCEKCWDIIYPEYINVLDGTVIKKVKNPNYNKYSKQQKKQHICKKEDLNTVKLIYENAKHCPICNELINKDGGCKDMFCYNCWLNGKKTLFRWDTMELTKTTTNEIFNHLMHSKGQQQARFDHPDAQRLRARGATINEIIKEYYKDKKYSNLLDNIKNILSIENISYNDFFLFEERIKYMFNFSSKDIELQQYHKYKPINIFNMNEIYKITPQLTTPSIEDNFKNISEKKDFIENKFKQFIFNEYIKKSFIQYYSNILSQFKEDVQNIIYLIKEDDYNKSQKPLTSYISNISNIVNTFNSQILTLKSSYPNLNYCNTINFKY